MERRLRRPEGFLAPDFRIRFGNSPERASGTDALRGPAGIVDLIARHRAESPGLRYAVGGAPLVDPALGRIAPCWYVTRPTGVRRAASTCSRSCTGASPRCGR
ncbi:hypothetical protein [Streptomyces sp. NBC_01235]|uniref:hypothetical protein n=1 Tax=Streptomyces sp. NBC_01235 TaxID=2903788 RepID=UPI002E13FB05|nr:hypothetical protein OG289_16100 [Streptomyces sp. NBC_01235]